MQQGQVLPSSGIHQVAVLDGTLGHITKCAEVPLLRGPRAALAPTPRHLAQASAAPNRSHLRLQCNAMRCGRPASRRSAPCDQRPRHRPRAQPARRTPDSRKPPRARPPADEHHPGPRPSSALRTSGSAVRPPGTRPPGPARCVSDRPFSDSSCRYGFGRLQR